MMYANKGNSQQHVDREVKVESLADDILRGDFLRVGVLASDACRLVIQFNAEGYLALRDQYDESSRDEQCNQVIEWAAERIHYDIIPAVFDAIVYGQEDEWQPIEEETQIKGLPGDIIVIYVDGMALAVAVFDADEYEPEPEEFSSEVEISAKPIRIEAIEAAYVDEAVVSQLGLSEEEMETYVRMLIGKAVDRFENDNDGCEMFRPNLAITKNQEEYFARMAEEYLWGKTEQGGDGYVIYN